MHNEIKVFSVVLVVFVSRAEFQDKYVLEYLSVMKFHEICMLRDYILSEMRSFALRVKPACLFRIRVH